MEDNKKEYFEAFLIELLNWYKEEYPEKDDNDLSKLKVLKLLFLGVSKDEEALNIFNNFKAWTLGPVEKDIYDLIKTGRLDIGLIDNTHFEKNDSNVILSKEAKVFGLHLVNFLKDKNHNLIKLSASSLVDITHKWNCWDIARAFNMDGISKNLILSEEGYYS